MVLQHQRLSAVICKDRNYIKHRGSQL